MLSPKTQCEYLGSQTKMLNTFHSKENIYKKIIFNIFQTAQSSCPCLLTVCYKDCICRQIATRICTLLQPKISGKINHI